MVLVVYQFSIIQLNFGVIGLAVIKANFSVSCAHHRQFSRNMYVVGVGVGKFVFVRMAV